MFKQHERNLRREPANRRMRANRVIKSLNVRENIGHSLFSRKIMMEMDTVTFKTTEKIFSNSIVIRVTFARHTVADIKIK